MTLKLSRLQHLRRQSGLTQEELAERLGMSRSSLANYETGLREPDFEATQTFADYFGVTVDYLIGRSDDRQTVNIPPEWKEMITVAQARGYKPDEVLKALEFLEIAADRARAELEKEERRS